MQPRGLFQIYPEHSLNILTQLNYPLEVLLPGHRKISVIEYNKKFEKDKQPLVNFLATGEAPPGYFPDTDPITAVGVTRKISLILPNPNGTLGPRFTFHGFGLGEWQQDKVYFGDVRAVRLVDTLPEEYRGRIFVTPRINSKTGEFTYPANPNPLGGYIIESAREKYKNTIVAASLSLEGVIVPEPVMWGTINDKYGFLVTMEPYNIELPEVIKSVEDTGDFLYKYLERLLQGHKKLIEAGYVHMQLHTGNAPIAVINNQLFVMITDWATMQSLNKFSTDSLPEKGYSPFEVAIIYDLRRLLSTYVAVVSGYLDNKLLWNLLGLVGDTYNVHIREFTLYKTVGSVRDAYSNKNRLLEAIDRALQPLIIQTVKNSPFIQDLKARRNYKHLQLRN